MKHLLIFIILLLALRALFVFAALDPIDERVLEVLDPAHVEWSSGPERPLFDREELYTGTAAEAIRMGLEIPQSKLQFMPYGGGSLLVSLLMVPIYSLFGPYYLSFKLFPLLVTLLGGIFWFACIRKWLNIQAAWAFGLLYLFAPSNFVRTILIAKGDHSEAMMIAAGVFLLATLAVKTTNPRYRPAYAAACGLLTGFGVFVTYSTIPVVFSILGAGFLLSRFRPLRIWLAGAVGLGVGLIPWLGRLIVNQDRIFQIYNDSAGTLVDLGTIFSRIELLFGNGWFAGYDLPGGSGIRTIAALIWMIVVIAGWIHLIRSAKKPFALLVLIGTLAQLAAFCFMAPAAASRYLMPGYPFLMVGVVVLAAGLKGRVNPVRAIPLIIVVLIGLTAQISTISQSSFRSLRTPLKGTDWVLLGEIAGQKLTKEELEQLPRDIQPFFATGVGTHLYSSVDREEWLSLVNQFDESLHPHIWEGIGIGVGISLTRAITDWGSFIDTLPPEEGDALVRGMARYSEGFLSLLAMDTRNPDLSVIQEHIVGNHASLFDLPRARTIGVLQTQGYAIQGGASAGLSSLTRYRGLGWALYKGFDNSGLRFNNPPAGISLDLLHGNGGNDGNGDDERLWLGLADAFKRDLEMLDPSWLLGKDLQPSALIDNVKLITTSVPSERVHYFYRAAGSACAKAWCEPSLPAEIRSRENQWSWRDTVPSLYADAFETGMREN